MDNYEISNYEYCQNVNDIPSKYPTSIKAYIPKYMPKVSGGDWQQKISIGGNLFVNAKECAITTPNTVVEQGYYEVKAYPNEMLNFENKYDDKQGCIPKGSKFLLEVMYGDPETMKLTGKV